MDTQTAAPKTVKVVLEHDVVTPDGQVLHAAGTEILVRKPGSGELRGLTLLALSQLDVATLQQLLPRITQPVLVRPAIDALDPADFMTLGGEVMDFLLPTAAKQAVSPQT